MGEHFGRKISDLFAFEAEVGEAVWARADVDHRSGECLQRKRSLRPRCRRLTEVDCPHLIERGEPGSIPFDASDFTQSFFKRRSEGDRAVLYINGVRKISPPTLFMEKEQGGLSAEW